jgi:hypothetical protein
MTALGDVAASIRSKNAGPFWVTVDIFLGDDVAYDRVARSCLTDPAVIADLYRIDPQSVLIFCLPALRAVKVSFPRPTIQGSLDDRDMHAGQQYVPLLHVDV